LNGTYIEFGAVVSDNFEEDLEASVTGSVDTSKMGVYVLTYTAKDTAGNEATPVTRTVTVGSASAPSSPSTGGSSSGGSSSGGSTTPTTPTTPSTPTTPTTPADATPPTITLNGPSSITLEVGGTYNELGATVSDNVDSGLSANITGVVNTGVLGTYTITYSASDRAGNTATPRIRTIRVVDTTRPVIRLLGAQRITISLGNAFEDPGALVTDNYDVNLVVTTTGEVNSNAEGTYTITYRSIDSSGNHSDLITRTVIVEAVLSESQRLTSPSLRVVSVDESNDNIDIAYEITDPDSTIVSLKINIYRKSNNELLQEQFPSLTLSSVTRICCRLWIREDTEYLVSYEADIDLRDGFGVRRGQILHVETVKTEIAEIIQQGSINWKMETADGVVFGGINGFNKILQKNILNTPVFSTEDVNILNYVNEQQLTHVMSKSNSEYRVQGEVYTLRIEGYFNPKESGEYIFSINNNDRIRFQIGDEILMNSTDRRIISDTGKFTVKKNLQAGKYYYINIVLGEIGGPEGLSILWQRPSENNTNQFFFHPDELVSYVDNRNNIALESKTITSSGFSERSDTLARTILLNFYPKFNSEVVIEDILLTSRLMGRFSANGSRSARIYFNNFLIYEGMPSRADWNGVIVLSNHSVGHLDYRPNNLNVSLSHQGIPDNMGKPGFIVTLEIKYRTYYDD
jgi:hypothetical protein